MVTAHARADAQLRQAYAQVPAIPGCQGHCWVSCGPAAMATRERQRLAAAGYKVTPEEQARGREEAHWCEALGPDGRCRAYDVRPLMCRVWGTSELLPCPFGCSPERWLTAEETSRLVSAVFGQPSRVTGDLSAEYLRWEATGGKLPAEVRNRT